MRKNKKENVVTKTTSNVEKSPIKQVICGSPDKPLVIGDIEIQCYVLEDETRVLSQRGLQQGIGMLASGAQSRLSRLIARFSSQPPELSVLSARIQKPIEFQPPRGGRTAFGYEATILADNGVA